MNKYKVEYTNTSDDKVQIVVQDHLDRKKEQLEKFLMQMVKHQNGFRKAKVETTTINGRNIKLRHRLMKDGE